MSLVGRIGGWPVYYLRGRYYLYMSDEEAGRPVLYAARDADCLIWWFIDWMPSAPPSKIRDAVLAAAAEAKCRDADVVGIIGWREPLPGGGYIDDFGEMCGDGERLWECRGGRSAQS